MNCCPGIGKSSRTCRPAQREDQNTVGLGGWLLLKSFCGEYLPFRIFRS
jgi:hypothetical protein